MVTPTTASNSRGVLALVVAAAARVRGPGYAARVIAAPLTCQLSGSGSGGSRELCDGIDNDCDTQIDEDVCNFCIDDDYESNDSYSAGYSLPSGTTYSELTLCGPGGASEGQYDWFELGTWATGFSATLTLTQYTGNNARGEAYADLDADFFCGTAWCAVMHDAAASGDLYLQ